ncbi:MAG: hypothetical protein WBC60_16270 [Cognaticolwellia sp.]
MPNYEQYTPAELLDVFINIDDQHYPERALTILSQLAVRLELDFMAVELTSIISNPTENRGRIGYFDTQYSLSESYTDDAVAVRDKLIRLKALATANSAS